MAKRIGKNTVELTLKPHIVSSAAVVGKKEGEGPLTGEFDAVFEDAKIGEETWEKAESAILRQAIETAIGKAGAKSENVDIIFSGDLLNQCISSTFSVRDMCIPFAGVYGACSTMALSLCLAALSLESGGFNNAIAATSSHFCSAEKQFRFPLEYAGQRPPTSQWTVTGAGAVVLDNKVGTPYIDSIHVGTVCDLGIKDTNNMGAAMAPDDDNYRLF